MTIRQSPGYGWNVRHCHCRRARYGGNKWHPALTNFLVNTAFYKKIWWKQWRPWRWNEYISSRLFRPIVLTDAIFPSANLHAWNQTWLLASLPSTAAFASNLTYFLVPWNTMQPCLRTPQRANLKLSEKSCDSHVISFQSHFEATFLLVVVSDSIYYYYIHYCPQWMLPL